MTLPPHGGFAWDLGQDHLCLQGHRSLHRNPFYRHMPSPTKGCKPVSGVHQERDAEVRCRKFHPRQRWALISPHSLQHLIHSTIFHLYQSDDFEVGQIVT